MPDSNATTRKDDDENGAEGTPFSRKEEEKIVKFIVDNDHIGEVNGMAVWKLIRFERKFLAMGFLWEPNTPGSRYRYRDPPYIFEYG